MSLDDRICAVLGEGPATTEEIAHRLREDVDRRLGLMLGTRVARDGGRWRLLDLPANAALANVARSVCAVVDGLAARRRRGLDVVGGEHPRQDVTNRLGEA